MAAFSTAMIYLFKDKIKIKGRINIKSTLRLVNIKSRKGHTARTSDYEDVKRDNTGRPKSAIDTKKNAAYGQGITLSTVASQ